MKKKGIIFIVAFILLFVLMVMAYLGANVLFETNFTLKSAIVMSGGVIVILLIGFRKEIKTLF